VDNKEMTKEEKQGVADAIEKDGEASKTLAKLFTDKVEVDVYKYRPLVEAAKEQVANLRKALEDSSKPDDYSTVLKNAEDELGKLENDKIQGYLTPITYREIQLIKAGIAEAQLETRKMNYDLDIQLLMSIIEQKILTVYFALKQKDGKTKFFKNLEEIAVLPDETVNDLFDLYMTKIGLSADERKNS